jgi:hypothetical protein
MPAATQSMAIAMVDQWMEDHWRAMSTITMVDRHAMVAMVDRHAMVAMVDRQWSSIHCRVPFCFTIDFFGMWMHQEVLPPQTNC